MPKSFKSVQDIETLKQRFGGVGYVCVVAMGGDQDELQRLADDLAPKLETLPAIRYVDYKRPATFFEDRALYFLSVDDLTARNTTLRRREPSPRTPRER